MKLKITPLLLLSTSLLLTSCIWKIDRSDNDNDDDSESGFELVGSTYVSECGTFSVGSGGPVGSGSGSAVMGFIKLNNISGSESIVLKEDPTCTTPVDFSDGSDIPLIPIATYNSLTLNNVKYAKYDFSGSPFYLLYQKDGQNVRVHSNMFLSDPGNDYQLDADLGAGDPGYTSAWNAVQNFNTDKTQESVLLIPEP